MAKAMDFPGSSKKKYSAIAISSNNDNEKLLIPVPGPQGPKGDTGDRGPQGEPGPKGDPGKDGKSYGSTSGQNPGWAYYYSNEKNVINLDPTKGDDGWITIGFKNGSLIKNELFLPKDSMSFWNEEGKKINFRSMKIGSKLDIRYDISIETYNNNTEFWFRTFYPNIEKSCISYIGNLKYQYEYDMSIYQTIFINDKMIWSNGGIPQARVDSQSSIFIKGIFLSVS